MNIQKLLVAAALSISVVTLAGQVQAAGIESFTDPVVWPNDDNEDYSLGWEFTTTGQTVYALGYNDYGFNSSHDVGIFNSGGTLLASVTVTGASTLVDGYRYTGLGSSLVLGAGTYRILGVTGGLNDGWIYQANNIVTNAATTYVASYFGDGGTLHYAENLASGRQYLPVNFLNDRLPVGGVPEPGTWALMILGFGGAGFALRRRNAVRPAA